MKLFDIKVHTSDREYDITLRNLTIIRASEILHRIGVACTALIRSIKRLLVPGKLVIRPLIKIRFIKSLKQKVDMVVDADSLVRSFKRLTVNDSTKLNAHVNVASMKKMREASTWRIIPEALISAEKPIADNHAVHVDANLRMQKVRKRRLGELSLVRTADMDSMTLDELDYVVAP